MSNQKGYVPKSLAEYALQIIARFRLEKAAAQLFIERVLQAAVDEELRTRHEREELACARCGIRMLRYQAIREEFRDCCPECREPLTKAAASPAATSPSAARRPS